MSKESWNGKLLKEVVEKLKEKKFKFKEVFEAKEGSMVESEPSKLGNFLWLRATNNIFLPAICNKSHKGAILEFADRIVRKHHLEKKFPLFHMGLHHNPANADSQKVARIIIEAFNYYESVWQNLMPEKELEALVERDIKRAEEKIFK